MIVFKIILTVVVFILFFWHDYNTYHMAIRDKNMKQMFWSGLLTGLDIGLLVLIFYIYFWRV